VVYLHNILLNILTRTIFNTYSGSSLCISTSHVVSESYMFYVASIFLILSTN